MAFGGVDDGLGKIDLVMDLFENWILRFQINVITPDSMSEELPFAS